MNTQPITIEARNELVNRHTPFVVYYVNRFFKKYPHLKNKISFNDLVQEGLIGLLIASQRYDESKGYQFLTYARWWVQQRINLHVTSMAHPIQVPNRVVKARNMRDDERLKLACELDRDPTNEELADRIGVTKDILSATYGIPASSNSFVPIEDAYDLGEGPDTSGTAHKQLHGAIIEAIESLDDRSKLILSLRYDVNVYKRMTC